MKEKQLRAYHFLKQYDIFRRAHPFGAITYDVSKEGIVWSLRRKDSARYGEGTFSENKSAGFWKFYEKNELSGVMKKVKEELWIF